MHNCKIFENINGITVRELKKVLESYPDLNEYDEDNEVWVDTGNGTSNALKLVVPLNVSDVLLVV